MQYRRRRPPANFWISIVLLKSHVLFIYWKGTVRSEKFLFLEFCMVNVNDTVARNKWKGPTAYILLVDKRRFKDLIRTLNIRDSSPLHVLCGSILEQFLGVNNDQVGEEKEFELYWKLSWWSNWP